MSRSATIQLMVRYTSNLTSRPAGALHIRHGADNCGLGRGRFPCEIQAQMTNAIDADQCVVAPVVPSRSTASSTESSSGNWYFNVNAYSTVGLQARIY